MTPPEYPHKVTQAAMVGCRGCSCVGYVCEYHDAFNDGVEALNALIDDHLGETIAEAIARNDIRSAAQLHEEAQQ